jgi:hypothetical protein
VDEVKPTISEPPMSRWVFAARLLWMAVQIILVLCLGERGVLFFYQGF